ncbi:hypothetical protein Sm713_44650 [Streptomyces sp. TS71-3]|nr:hypothetical protein Sm713_44650 [Streptomyces sp. TS71-3]
MCPEPAAGPAEGPCPIGRDTDWTCATNGTSRYGNAGPCGRKARREVRREWEGGRPGHPASPGSGGLHACAGRACPVPGAAGEVFHRPEQRSPVLDTLMT